MSDELDARLARSNPVDLDEPVDPADSPRAATLRRTIMSTPIDVADGGSTAAGDGRQPGSRRQLVLVAAGALVAAAAAGVIVVQTLDDGGTTPAAATTVTYDLPASDPMSSCLPVADNKPVDGGAAFAGVVTSVEGDQVVLDVERWYAGGEADEVQLTSASPSVALDGVEFEVGAEYLVRAVDGTVEICGVSGPASRELERLYERWYS